MKSKESKSNNRSHRKLLICIGLVAGLCYLNSMAVEARDYPANRFETSEKFRSIAQQAYAEKSFVQNWLFNFHMELITQIAGRRAMKAYQESISSGYGEQFRPSHQQKSDVLNNDNGSPGVLGLPTTKY
jgi:hypothetical protein